MIGNLRFQTVEKRFGDGIVVAVPLAAHALDKTVPGKQAAKIFGRVLASAIRQVSYVVIERQSAFAPARCTGGGYGKTRLPKLVMPSFCDPAEIRGAGRCDRCDRSDRCERSEAKACRLCRQTITA